MSKTSKFKWIGGIILAGILLAVGLLGGDWGTNNIMPASANAYPVINAIIPFSLPAGSADKVVIISGTIDGQLNQTRIRFTGNGIDVILTPIQVISASGASVTVPKNLMGAPAVYTVRIIVSDYGTIPTLPLWTGIDLESNPGTFTVFQPIDYYLPIITGRP